MKKLSMILMGCLVSLTMLAEETGLTASCMDPRAWINNVSYRSVNIGWGKQTDHLSYEIHYEKKVNWSSYYNDITVLGSATSMTIDNLQPSTEYVAQVVAKCAGGGSVYSNLLEFTTLAKPVCKTPSNVQVSNITDQSATITWTPGEEGQTQWEVKCEVAGTTTDYIFPAYTNTYVIDGVLTFNTDYYVSVRALCYDDPSGEMFYSEYSDGKAFKTSATPSPNVIPQVEHSPVKRESDPYTCLATEKVTISSSYMSGNPDRISFYEILYGGIIHTIAEDASSKTLDLYPYAGTHTYIVTALDDPVNAPARQTRKAIQSRDASNWPTTIAGYDVEQYDIWTVNVKYHVENHDTTIATDMFTDLADFQVYTTAGQVEASTGKTFCGLDFKYVLNQGTSESLDALRIIDYDATKVNDVLTLGIGTYTYSGYMVSREGEILWCDRFNINVVAPNCTSGLVYSKWDDFMFVDNGDGGGKGTFVAYQWFKDGKAIKDATKQWMRTTLSEGALPSGKYHVEITDDAGKKITTCPLEFPDIPRSQISNTHTTSNAPAKKQIVNGQLRIEHNGKWYNAQGMEIK